MLTPAPRVAFRVKSVGWLAALAAVVTLSAGDAAAATFTISPSSLSFITQVVTTTSAAKTLTIKNTGPSTTFTATPSLPDYAVATTTCGDPVATGATCTVTVTFTPAALGSRPATLAIRDSNNASNTLSATLTGSGVAATTVSPTKLAFGNVVQNTVSAPKTFLLTNNQDVALNNVTIAAQNSDYATSGCPATLAPRSSCTVSVTFAPTKPAPTAENSTLLITHSAVTSPQSIPVTGTSVLPLAASTKSLSFASTLQGETRTSTALKLTNYQTRPVSAVAFAFTGPFSATGCSTPIAAGGSCVVTLTFAPTAAHLGTVKGSVKISSPDPTVWNQPVVALTGTAALPVTILPSLVDFGNVTVAATGAAKAITITNKSSTRTLTFGNPAFALTGDFVQSATTCSTQLAPLASCVVNVSFRPTVGGARTGRLTVTHSAVSSPQSISLKGNGTTPVTITPTSLAFGKVGVGLVSAGKLVTLKNNQSVPVTFNGIVATGDFAKQDTSATTTTCQATLAPGASCDISVVLKPTVGEARTGDLIISSDTSASPNRLALTGTGINGVTASVTSLAFASQKVGDPPSVAKAIVLTNHQSLRTTFTTSVAGDYKAVNACNSAIEPLATCVVSVTFAPQATGSRAGAVTFAFAPGSSTTAKVTLSGTGTTNAPPAAVRNVSPGAAERSASLQKVVISGNGYTHFTAQSTVSFGNDITVSAPNCGAACTANTLTVDVTVGAAATPGPRTVVVTTPLPAGGTETASLTSGFIVASSAASIASVQPYTAAQAQTLDVDIFGGGTHFESGVTSANFGDGIFVSSLTVLDETHAVASITVSPTASLGWRAITIVTGGEYATLAPTSQNGPGFLVTESAAKLASLSQSSGVQGGTPFVITITGEGTNFRQSATQVSFGAGINIGNIVVISPVQLQVNVAVTGGATPGPRDVVVTTGGERATLTGGFTVTPSETVPYLTSVVPAIGRQGQSLAIVITAANTHFLTDAPAPLLELGSNIAINSLQVINDTTIHASVSIDLIANVGGRGAMLTSGGTAYPFSFAVLPSSASVVNVNPPSGPQGKAVSITVTGQNTHWDQSTTAGWFGGGAACPTGVIDRLTVNSPTEIVLDLTIPPGACLGAETFYLATGGEVVSATFTVYAQTPSLTLNPASATPGSTLTVNFTGEFSHFTSSPGGPTTAVIDGALVDIQNFQVLSPTSAKATFVVAGDALTGPCWPNPTAGCHTVTVSSPLAAGGTEILTAFFQVTSTPARLLTIEPFHAAPGSTTTVRILGSATNFTAGVTTVSFGPNTSTTALTVVNKQELTVKVTVGSDAALGWRSAFVNTGAEQLTIGFRVDGPGSPIISSASPASGAQGQSLTVTITGQNTHFDEGSDLILGAGITVSDFNVTSPTTATAVVAISPTAPIGQNTIVVLTPTGTGEEVASGLGFSVTRGAAQVTAVSPSAVAQDQTLNVAITGQGTHWRQGETAADFGAGIHVNQLTIVDATHATAQITVLTTAALGFHTVTLVTDGETASLVQAVNVQQSTPLLLNSSPNSGFQGTTFNVQVLGSFTHWQQGMTDAVYGDGIAVNSFTVIDSVSALANVTISPLAYLNCYPLTVTTGFEQVILFDQLCVQPGAAIITGVEPNRAVQNSTTTVTVTGLGTHFTPGVTTADFGPGIGVGNVTVLSATTAILDVAVPTNAASGLRTVVLKTQGETAAMAYGFAVGSDTPTLNGSSPNTGQPGQSLTVRLIGQFTHWASGVTTATFGDGITVNGVTVVDQSTADVSITIDSLAAFGARTVTVTTGGEIVSRAIFSVVSGPAIISDVTPESANQGQEIALTITGQNTHWAQGLTQFSMPGIGSDIKVNYVIVNSATSATVGITIAKTAVLGARSVYMVTGGESLVDANAVIITGGIPAVASLAPGSAKAGDTAVNVQITGLYTHWLTGTTTVSFGPGITLQTYTVNNDTSITAVINVDQAAGIGTREVSVRNGAQSLTGYFQVLSANSAPTPRINYLSPWSALRGQTLTIAIGGQDTQWDPSTSTFNVVDGIGSGITVNSFQITSPTSARANVTIAANAALGARTLEISTGTELVQATFSVVQETPLITIVDPVSGMQGASLTVNVIGQYTTFTDSTMFDFGPGITVTNVTVLGPTIAQVTISIDQLALKTFRAVSATTDEDIVNSRGGVGFLVTASQAVVVSVSPNTARQQDTLAVAVTGENTHWNGTTQFDFGSGMAVVGKNVIDETHASLTLSIDALAPLGVHSLSATTGGESAQLASAFVVQPGTPLILSSSPASGQQQQNITLTILGQYTQWVDGITTVGLGNGVTITSVNVTSPEAITVTGQVQWWASPGYRTLSVTADAQTLELPYAFLVTNGPAVVGSLSPAQAGQGVTLDVDVTGVNTHFVQGQTLANFGPGVSANTVTVTSDVTARVNVTVAANAPPAQNTVTMTTLGETASKSSAFLIQQTTGVLQFVTPANVAQGSTTSVTVIGDAYTNFVSGTTFSFGPGVTVNTVSITDGAHATVNLTVSPLAARTTRDVTAVVNGTTITGTNLFTVTAGPAYISAVSPVSGKQNQTGLQVTMSGNQTHFTAATPTVSLGPGVTVTQVQVTTDTLLTATVNILPSAVVQAYDVTVTTLGEVATLPSGFSVQPGTPIVSAANPVTGRQNDTLNVVVTGLYTHFVQNTTGASFGAGITVNSVTVTSETQATVNITIQKDASTGSRTIVLTTGSETASGVGAFTVLAGQAQLLSVSPSTGAQGSTQTLTITGVFTHFQPNQSQVSFSGSGVSVGTVTVNGAEQIQVPVTVTAGAAAGARSVTVTTGTEVVTLINAFTVEQAPPSISVISPNVGVPNSMVTVTITGQFTNFANGTTQARFGAGIAVNGAAEGALGTIVVNSATSATATLAINSAATLGPRDVRVQTGEEALDVLAGFTVQSSTPTPPSVTLYAPRNGAPDVPINTAVTLQFSAPIDRTTVNTSNVRVTDLEIQGWCYYNNTSVPGTLSVDASGRIVTFRPSEVLAVRRQYSICVNYTGATLIKDPSGNSVSASASTFTTSFVADNAGPSFIGANIANGDSTVPTNAPIVLGFSTAISPISAPGGILVTTGGSTVPGTLGYTADYKRITFTPAATLTANTAYVVTYSALLVDSVGNAVTNPGSFGFTTGSGPDFSAPQYVSWTPAAYEVTGTTPTVRFTFNEPLDPLRLDASVVYVQDQVLGRIVTGTSLALSSDRKTVTLTLTEPLDPGTVYRWTGYLYDRVGYYTYGGDYFRTAAGQDSTALTVASVAPANGETAVPVNAKVRVVMSEQVDRTSPATLTMTPAVQTTYTLGNGDTTLTFTPAATLLPNTVYSATLSGLRDTSGNLMAPFEWTFTTAASATPDTTNGTITSVVPASNATNVSTTAPVTVSLGEAVDPTSVDSLSVRIYDNTAGQDVPGSLTIAADLRSIIFTPTFGYQGAHQICVYVSYFAYVRDAAGNPFNYAALCFTTAATADTTPPQVIAVTPFDGATGIGPNNPVTVTFSEPLKISTMYNGNVALFNGSTLVTTGVTPSADGTAVTINTGSLTYGTTYTVVVSPNVTDVAGNSLPIEFTSTFTIAPQPVTTHPQVLAFRPGAGLSGVSPTLPLTFFLSQPVDPSTVSGALYVAQNGVLITGTTTVGAGDQVITFVPSLPFARGSLVQVWLTSAATDVAGNYVYEYQASFRIAVDGTTTAAAFVSAGPAYSSGNPLTTAPIVRFSKALNPATVTASTFYMKDCSFNPIATTIAVVNDNTAIRLKPTAPLAPNACYYFFWTNGILDVDGLAISGSNFYFYTGTTSDTTAPAVVSVAPVNGATSIGVNGKIRLTFSEAIEASTIDATTLTLIAGASPIPYSVASATNGDGTMTVTLTPLVPLPASSAVTFSVTSAVADTSANGATPFTATFTTAAAPNFSSPAVISSTVAQGDTNVPVSSVFTLTFDRPMDARPLTQSGGIYLQDVFTGQVVPAALSVSADRTQVTIAPSVPLGVNRTYSLVVLGYVLFDLTGNAASSYSAAFTTALYAPVGGPQVVLTVPYEAMLNVPVNFKPEIKFDRSVSRPSLAAVTLTANGSPVTVTPQFATADTVVTLVPSAILKPSTDYVLTIAGVTDIAGQPMTSSVVVHFKTGPSIDLVGPSIVAIAPSTYTSTSPVIRVVVNEPLDPIRAVSGYLVNQHLGFYVPGVSFSYSSDWRTVTMTYAGPLDPTTAYSACFPSFWDLAGNYGGFQCTNFQTTAGADTDPFTVVSVNPGNGAGAVPLNAAIAVRLNKAADPTSFTGAGIALTPSVPGTRQLSSDGLTLKYVVAGQLSPNTTYAVNVGGFADSSGNSITPFSSTFTTSSATDTSGGTISLTSPAPGSTGVDINATITLTLTEPVDPTTVNAQSVRVYDNTSGYDVAGSLTLAANLATITFTPTLPYPGNHQICVYASYFAYLRDAAGNPMPYLAQCFTIGVATDTTPPQLLSVTPFDGSTNIGPRPTVTLVFSESLNSSTVAAKNFALYNGFTRLNTSISWSTDVRTVMLNGDVPYNSTITLVVGTGVQDLAGNPLGTPFRSTFSTLARSQGSPYVTLTRPGSGASEVPVDSSVTFYSNKTFSASSTNGVAVSQNGVLIAGTTTIEASGYALVFRPSQPFAPGSLIQAFLTDQATDANGTPISYSLAFYVVPNVAAQPLQVVNLYPSNGTGGIATNTVVEVKFNKPVDPAFANSSYFKLLDGSGSTVAATVTQVQPAVLRLVPNASLAVNALYYPLAVAGLRAADGTTLGSNYQPYFYTGTTADTLAPTVAGVAPPNGATGVGDNATLRVTFDKVIDDLTFNATTAQLTSSNTSIPYSVAFSINPTTNGTMATITPHAPLPDNASVTLALSAGITDRVAQAITPETVTFQTRQGPDMAGPVVVRRTPDVNQATNVPVNTTRFAWTFDEPLDASRLHPGYQYLYLNAPPYGIVPTTATLSSDGTTLTLTAASNLLASTSYSVCMYYPFDLAGNLGNSTCTSFTTASSASAAVPQVIATSPVNGNLNAAINSLIEIVFSEPVASTSLGQITMTSNGNPVPFSIIWSPYYANLGGGRVIELIPNQLLTTATNYSVTVTGVQTIAGVPMSGPYTFSFKTGANNAYGEAVLTSGTVTANGVQTQLSSVQTVADVSPTSSLTFTFSGAVTAASVLNRSIVLEVASTSTAVPTTVAMSSDGKTVTLMPQSPLALNTQYRVRVHYYAYTLDEAGYYLTAGVTYNFTTAPLAIDFEDLPDSYVKTTFPTNYRGIVWTNWYHYAPYPAPYTPNGVNAIFGAVDGAKFTFSERVFTGAVFSRYPGLPGDVYFELYRGGTLVATSGIAPLTSTPTFLSSGYSGVVDEVRVRSLGSSMTVNGAGWIIDDITFAN